MVALADTGFWAQAPPDVQGFAGQNWALRAAVAAPATPQP